MRHFGGSDGRRLDDNQIETTNRPVALNDFYLVLYLLDCIILHSASSCARCTGFPPLPPLSFGYITSFYFTVKVFGEDFVISTEVQRSTEYQG